MFYFHEVYRFRNSLWFIPVYRKRFAGSNSTKPAAACANISKNHKSGGTCTPAFSHIWAITAFANCMKLMLVNQIADLFKIFTDGKFNTKPVRFLNTGFCYINRRNDG